MVDGDKFTLDVKSALLNFTMAVVFYDIVLSNTASY